MTDHLPDCDDYAFSGAGYHPDCERICICRQVRRIEQRVTERWESLRGWGESYAYKTGSDNGFLIGYAAGLDAAREAVASAGVRKDTSYDMRMQALAAIDALREGIADV